jgi:hypothetical protein
LVLRHAKASSKQAPVVLVQNYASSIVAWSDVFDVHAAPCDAWWLRAACADDGSGLCVGDVDQLRTMQARLARAAQLAVGGGKWGLLQAVLLSWDSVPASAESWVRQQIALEACGLLILPAAGQGLDTDLKGAWEALPGKEQQLWCQLQQARIIHSRHGLKPVSEPRLLVLGQQPAEPCTTQPCVPMHSPPLLAMVLQGMLVSLAQHDGACDLAAQAGVDHYIVDRPAIAAQLKCATGVEEAGALLVEPALELCVLLRGAPMCTHFTTIMHMCSSF